MQKRKQNITSFWGGAALVLTALALLLACQPAVDTLAPEPSEPPAVSVRPTVVLTAVPSPTPKIELCEPVRDALPDDLAVPNFYTALEPSEGGLPCFAFTNETGVVEYRTVGRIDTKIDGKVTRSRYAFFEADADGGLAGTNPIDPKDEIPGICTAEPTEGLRVKKVLQRTGIASHYLDTRSETPAYVVYGRVGGSDAAFYAADEDGNMLPGALPIAADSLIVSEYAPSYEPQKDGERQITVFIGTQSVVVFRAENGDWEIEHIFICSTGDGGKYTPRGEFKITQQYEYKAMSRMNGVMVYAQYASRFQGHYLFHTTPTVGQYKNRIENGKQQMMVAEYEKLGTAVSHGCVRMLVGDCYWIYRNCRTGTRVTVTDDEGPQPPPKPALIYAEPYMDKNHELGWDPTDPSPYNPYRELDAYDDVLVMPTLDPKKTKTARPTKLVTPRPTETPAPSVPPGSEEPAATQEPTPAPKP